MSRYQVLEIRSIMACEMVRLISSFILAELREKQLEELREERRCCNYCDNPVNFHMMWTQTDGTGGMEHNSANICDEHARQVSIGMGAVLKLPAAKTTN